MRFMDLVLEFFCIQNIWIKAVVAGTMLFLDPLKLHIAAVAGGLLSYQVLLLGQRLENRFH